MLLIIALYGIPNKSHYYSGTKTVPCQNPDFSTAQTSSGYGCSDNALDSFKIGGGKVSPELKGFIDFISNQRTLEGKLPNDCDSFEVAGYWFQRDTGNLNLGVRVITKEKNTLYDIPIAKVTGTRKNAITETLAEKIGDNIWLIKGNRENYLLQVFYDSLEGREYIEFETLALNDPISLKPVLKKSA